MPIFQSSQYQHEFHIFSALVRISYLKQIMSTHASVSQRMNRQTGIHCGHTVSIVSCLKWWCTLV